MVDSQEFLSTAARIQFFAGAHVMWRKVLELSLMAHEGELTPDEGLDFLDEVRNELFDHQQEDGGPVAGTA